ncbi:hypothetical protein [Actinomycetospora atypica]|uniref:Uncharacterized protein n=1 Tax=Actinomycetospora atypica TaxID=1290095 RepID=A0ABV9YHQ7_9PSEU
MTNWLDMSQYPATDPDSVLTADETHLLRSLLTQHIPDVADELWRRMLDITWTVGLEVEVESNDDHDHDHDHDVSTHLHDEGQAEVGDGAVVTDWDGTDTASAFLDLDVADLPGNMSDDAG